MRRDEAGRLDGLEDLLEQAWQVRQASYSPVLGVDDLRRTRTLSLTGSDCALDCAHCGRHYLEAMLSVAVLGPDDPRLSGYHSLLISGGCDAQGRVPVTAHLGRVRALRPGRRLNWHTGLIGEQDLQAIAPLADVVSFDLVGDDATIAEVYGLEATVADYRATYRLLRRTLPVVPHITVGLRGGRLSGEREALRLLEEEGASAIVFLVFIPTPGTRYARRAPPPVEEVARLLAEARITFPDVPLALGCMRPGGSYRRALDPLALRAGVNRIVKPHRDTLALPAGMGLQVQRSEECCALVLVNVPPVPRGGLGAGASPGLSVGAILGEAPGGSVGGPSAPTAIRVSAGTEVILGLRWRPMDAAPTTAYLMLDGGGCAMACAFCAQARGSEARADALSRIIWPAHPTEAVFAALARARDTLGRVCFQVTLHRGAPDEVAALVRDLRRHSDHPISVAIRPPDVGGVGKLLAAGVDVIGLGLDCAAESVYRQVKGAGWRRMIDLVESACRRYSGHIRVHLMVGLGETEAELCCTMQQVYDWGGAVGLFAFTPIRGTPLADRPQPPLDVYRRVQVAQYLLDRGWARVEQFRFGPEGCLVEFGRPDLREQLADGQAFRTSGCPDCNRPFYNERPGGTMYNYPRPLTPEEVERAVREMDLPLSPGGP